MSPTDIGGPDELFVQIENSARPMHWALVLDLEADTDTDTDALVGQLHERVRERVVRYPQFRLGVVDSGRLSAPQLREYSVDDAETCIEFHSVATESESRRAVGELLARPLSRDRPSWRLVLVEQRSPHRYYLVLAVHHSLADGIAGVGYAALFLDDEVGQLEQLDRYLSSERFAAVRPKARDLGASMLGLISRWGSGIRSARLPAATGSDRREIAYVDVPTSRVRSIALGYSASIAEYLVATIGAAVAETLAESEVSIPRTLRAIMPVTLDGDLRHSGNAISTVLVNLPGAATESFDRRLQAARSQLNGIKATRMQLALPAVAGFVAGMPWLIRSVAAQTILATLRPDLHIGVNPGYLRLRSTLGLAITGLHPLSPLFGNALSITCVLLGSHVHVGIVWDPQALGDHGEQLATRLSRQLIADSPAVQSIPTFSGH
ncbi:wax ester/triacylglycerol synthase domain-containing protein [Nocardia tengchongensis]|uniref:wax ester/triacylglycerol synthase domain-containing protein n=1 Tax=Nocardia tengchongensis TaxID=2055889 RepID=UPI00369ECA8B